VCRESTAVSCRVQAAGEWRSMWGGEEGNERRERSRGISGIESSVLGDVSCFS
jgi:hypothetical protein